jgi:pimeloyl-ACP methyl ester carboxylesterase
MRNFVVRLELLYCVHLLVLLPSCSQDKKHSIKEGDYVVLHDGRKLSYRSYGNVEGEPVFYFHGFPSSGQEVMLNNGGQKAKELNLRIIAVNRPGYGNSDFKPGRTLLDWPEDIAELADSLGIDTFSVLGVSGGGPYAIVCAYKIPGRLKKVGVVSGVGPYNAPGAKKGAAGPILKSPRFIRSLIFKGFKKVLEKNPEKVVKKMYKQFPEADRAILDMTEERDVLLNALREGLSAGPAGAKQDAEIYKNNWGFDLEDVKQKVYLWHGEEDLSVRIETGKYVADQLGNCVPKFYREEGHFSLLYNKADEIYSLFVSE